ncbi:MAG: glycosyltransferase family 4 protein [Anaerolineae bacterium]|nr:glycosyltransferase family 4 protein [Anaerolineae bacterium]
MPNNSKPKTQDSALPVLFASSFTGFGGGETSLFEMVRCLDPARFTPHLLVPREGAFPALWREQGWPVHVIPWRPATPVFVPEVWARFPVVGQIAALLRREGIAVARPEYHSVPLVAPACARVGAPGKTGIPWVWMVHGQWTHPRPWQRGLFRTAAHLFADSGWSKDGFLGQPPFLPPERVEVRHLGVDVARFTPGAPDPAIRERYGLAPDAPVITILGRFQPVKGHLNFLDMAALLAPEYPAARFLIVGDNVLDGAVGDRQAAAMRARIEANPDLRRAVVFTGFTHELVAILRATDVLVCASDFESFGMAHLEAMACAVPVVSTNVGGPAETVLDGQTGFLVPPRDPVALAEAVRPLLDDPDLRARLGQAGRAHVLDKLDVHHYAARFAEVLTQVVR